jgi:hypothetical protein
LFSPTYEAIIFLIWRVVSSWPRPKSSTPALFEIAVSFLDAGIAQRQDQRLRNPAQPETADGDGLAVLDDAVECGACIRIHFVHTRPFSG